MRPRTELALGAGLFLALAVVAGLVGSSRSRLTDGDTRRSTFLAGPGGAQGWAEALERLGVGVERFRRPVAALVPPSSPRTLVAFLGSGLTSREGLVVAGLHADLLLAGPDAGAAFRCLGYDIRPHWRDSLVLVPPAGVDRPPFPAGHAELARRPTNLSMDSTDAEDAPPVVCTAPAARRVDTLLRSASGRVVALRAALSDGRTVTLVADDGLFANRALRESGAGPFALGLVVPRYDRVVVDEYHHGFDASRSMAGAATEWMLRSPWGWAILQLAGVGVLGLVAAGVRFGPIHSGVERRRRSPLEHVRALATALAAARGHDVAVGLIVQGLRRRLSRAGRISRGELGPWLDGLGPAVRTPGGRAALDNLTAITRRPASADDVRLAADAVETLWEELTRDDRHTDPAPARRGDVARGGVAPPRGGARRRGARPVRGGAEILSRRCWPGATCSWRACRARPRRCSSARWDWRSGSSSGASSSRRISCRPTSPA